MRRRNGGKIVMRFAAVACNRTGLQLRLLPISNELNGQDCMDIWRYGEDVDF